MDGQGNILLNSASDSSTAPGETPVLLPMSAAQSMPVNPLFAPALVPQFPGSQPVLLSSIGQEKNDINVKTLPQLQHSVPSLPHPNICGENSKTATNFPAVNSDSSLSCNLNISSVSVVNGSLANLPPNPNSILQSSEVLSGLPAVDILPPLSTESNPTPVSVVSNVPSDNVATSNPIIIAQSDVNNSNNIPIVEVDPIVTKLGSSPEDTLAEPNPLFTSFAADPANSVQLAPASAVITPSTSSHTQCLTNVSSQETFSSHSDARKKDISVHPKNVTLSASHGLPAAIQITTSLAGTTPLPHLRPSTIVGSSNPSVMLSGLPSAGVQAFCPPISRMTSQTEPIASARVSDVASPAYPHPTLCYTRILLGEITPLLAAMRRATPRWSQQTVSHPKQLTYHNNL